MTKRWWRNTVVSGRVCSERVAGEGTRWRWKGVREATDSLGSPLLILELLVTDKRRRVARLRLARMGKAESRRSLAPPFTDPLQLFTAPALLWAVLRLCVQHLPFQRRDAGEAETGGPRPPGAVAVASQKISAYGICAPPSLESRRDSNPSAQGCAARATPRTLRSRSESSFLDELFSRLNSSFRSTRPSRRDVKLRLIVMFGALPWVNVQANTPTLKR
jgi:hypothetical protein